MRKTLFLSIFCLISSLAFSLNPSREYAVTPGDFGLNFEVVTIPTEDNLNLYGWFFSATREGSSKVVIISDDGEGNMADLLDVVSSFLSLGYNVLTYDYRGFGKSDDANPAIKNNFYIYAQFEKDLNGSINYVKKYYSKLRTMQLYGRGIGAGLSIAVGVNRPEVSKVVADSPYSTLEGMKNRLKEKESVDVLLPLGFDKKGFEPEYALQSKGANMAGIMFIGGDADEIVSTKDIKALMKFAKCPSYSYFVKGANRFRTIEADKEKYFQEIEKFLK
ncbi:MAG: alpha/beta hydrolase [Bacteroidota bacterium]